MFTWAKHHPDGYECSTLGDRRFSAMCARMADGRTIEMHYQCDVKGYDPGGMNWKLGKGKTPLDPFCDLWLEYLNLWQTWAESHLLELADLHAKATGFVLTDKFATTDVNQARALAHILNNMTKPNKRTIICGSRSVTHDRALFAALDACGWDLMEIETVLCGDAAGADEIGYCWADSTGRECEHYPADWNTHGRSAGFIRNHEMATKADSCIALWDRQSNGTEHMINTALVKGLKVYVHDARPYWQEWYDEFTGRPLKPIPTL